jgi:hypothetical protein
VKLHDIMAQQKEEEFCIYMVSGANTGGGVKLHDIMAQQMRRSSASPWFQGLRKGGGVEAAGDRGLSKGG